MQKIVGIFSVIEQAEKALRDLEATGIKPNKIIVYSDEGFDAIERNIGLPVSYMPSVSNFIGYNSTYIPFSINATESVGEPAFFGKIAVEITSDEDELTHIGVLFRNHGASDVKRV